MDSTFWAQYAENSKAPVWFVPIPTEPYSGFRNPVVGALVVPYNCEDPQALTWQDLPDMQNTATPGPPAIGLNQGYKGLQPGDPSLLAAVQSLGPGYVSRPSSAHPGGFHMTFCDGHTTFMSQDVSYQIYAELMTPYGKYARIPGSRPVVQGSIPSVLLQNWQTAPISADSLSP